MSIIYPSSETATTINRAVKNVMGTTTTTDGAVDDGLIISENLQPVVECTPGMDYKITDKTITGTPPLSFHAIAQHLFDWSIDGNTDSGNSVGDKTPNLFDGVIGVDNVILNEYGTYDTNTNYALSNLIPVVSNTTYTYSFYHNIDEVRSTYAISEYDENGSVIPPLEIKWLNDLGIISITFTTGENTKYIKINWKKPTDEDMMLVLGSTALPYEPYGYGIPIVVNTTDTYHCYITDVLRKSDSETPVYDTMSSDGTIIRRVDTDGTPLAEPTTETYTALDITVNWGWNTVDVDTTVSPSNMIINYKDN